jgi:pilus assembly protein CpaF
MSRELAERVHRRLLDSAPSSSPLRERLQVLARAEAPLLDEGGLDAVVESVAARASGLGALEPLLADAAITEIMCNGPGSVWIERSGRLERLRLELDADEISLLIERVLTPLGLRVDRTSPLVDARLPDGSRVNAVVPPLAIDGPCLTIRRFGARAIGLDEVAPPDVATFLRDAVLERRNILVSGGTGAGKTTLLNALAACLPRGERVVTIEDAAELRLPLEHVVRLEARRANAEGAGAVSVRDLVRNSLRMRPDRIVVGEVRGAEALDMVQAMNTGHEGSLSTCHANGPADALRRVETMVLAGAPGLPLPAIREQLASSVDLVVHVARRAGGARRVVAVAEVVPLGDEAGTRPLAVRTLASERGMVDAPTRPPRGEAAR